MRSITGVRNIGVLKAFLENENGGIGTLKGTPEWEAIRELVANVEQETNRA